MAEAVAGLLRNDGMREACAREARRYAEESFDIESTASRFEDILLRVVEGRLAGARR